MDQLSVETSDVYPDKIFLVGRDMFFGARCATTPMKSQNNWPKLLPGNYLYTRGLHIGASLPPYFALRQFSPVRVMKNEIEQTDTQSSDLFHINIHKGINYIESGSAGCISVEPAIWDAFITFVDRSMSISNQSTIDLLFREYDPNNAWIESS